MAFTDLLGFMWNNTSDNFFSLEDSAVGSLEFDSIDTEVHDWQRDVTKNPVENGSPVADHIIERPRSITITGMISNAPVEGSSIFSSLAGGLNSDEPVAAAFTTLDQLYKSKSLLTIYTRYATYVDMVITNINIPRSPDVGDAIVFTIQATQIRIVSTQTTELPTGVGVKKESTGSGASGKAGASNSLDSATQKRAAATQNNGKSTSDKGLLEGAVGGIGGALDSLKKKASDAIAGWG